MADPYCDNCTRLCMEEHDHEHEDSECTAGDGNNVGLAFGITIGAGFAIFIGALLPFLPCFKRSNITLLAVGLGLSAGFLVYISFVEILGESREYFHCHTEDHAALAATGCFFLGIPLTILLEFFVDRLQRLDIDCCPQAPWKKAKTDGELDEQDRKKYSGIVKSLKSKVIGESSDCDKEEKTIGETKFNSTTAESEIVVMTDENSDEVSIFTKYHSLGCMLITVIIIPATIT